MVCAKEAGNTQKLKGRECNRMGSGMHMAELETVLS